MMKKIVLSFCILGLLFSFNSCKDKWEEPEFVIPRYTGPEANKTIQDIIDVYDNAQKMDSICSSSETFIVKAVVVSSDEGGNFYKSMVVQDETAAIQIQINKTGLFNYYPVGQTIYIDCRGLVVGNNRGVYQIGWIYQGSVGRIDGDFLDNYFHKDGLPIDISPMITTINSPADLNQANVNKLVTITNCEFAPEAVGQVWASQDYTTNRAVAYVNGIATDASSPLVVRTSNYANFINYRVPSGYGNITGILSVYQSGQTSTYQLMLRTKEDVGEFGILTDVYPISFDANSFTTGGWASIDNDEDGNSSWGIATYQNFKFMNHEPMTEACDDWLVSPEIPISVVEKSTLYIEHFNNLTGSTEESYKLYYCTNYNGTINENDWHELPITNYPSEFGLSNAISIENIHQNFRLAFRYHNTEGITSQWGIKSIRFNKLIQQ